MKVVCKICILLWLAFFAFELFAQLETEITVKELEEHVYFLASDSLKGRKPGTAESKIAAEYIRDNFIEFGLQPIGEDGFQYFDVIMSVEPGDGNTFLFDGHDQVIFEDFKPMPFSANGSLDAEVIFAGCLSCFNQRTARYGVILNATSMLTSIATGTLKGIGPIYGPIIPVTNAIGTIETTTTSVA